MTTKYSRPRAPETNTAQFFLRIIFCWRFRPTEKTPTIICLSSQIQITVRYLFSQKKNQRSMTICNTSAPHRLCSRSTVYWLRFREQSAHTPTSRDQLSGGLSLRLLRRLVAFSHKCVRCLSIRELIRLLRSFCLCLILKMVMKSFSQVETGTTFEI